MSAPVQTNYPNGFAYGLTVRGMPLLQAQPGQAFWLSNSSVVERGCSAGADSNPGTYQKPFSTLQGAVNAMQAKGGAPGGGDILFIKPGHAETVSSSTALNLSYSDLAIIGLGAGTNRPKFTLDTAATSTIGVTGDGISIQNCQFIANFADIAAAFTHSQASVTASFSNGVMTVSAVGSGTLSVGNKLSATGLNQNTVILQQLTGTTGGTGTYQVSGAQTLASTTVTTVTKYFDVDSCYFFDTSAVLNFLSTVKLSTTDNASDGLTLNNNWQNSKGLTANTAFVDLRANVDALQITQNNIQSLVAGNSGLIYQATTTKVLTNVLVDRNTCNFVGANAATGGLLITTATTHSGMFSRNFWTGARAAATAIIVTASSGFKFMENYYQTAADKSGILIPANV